MGRVTVLLPWAFGCVVWCVGSRSEDLLFGVRLQSRAGVWPGAASPREQGKERQVQAEWCRGHVRGKYRDP